MNKELEDLMLSNNDEDVILALRMILETHTEEELLKDFPTDSNTSNYIYRSNGKSPYILVYSSGKGIFKGSRYFQYISEITEYTEKSHIKIYEF